MENKKLPVGRPTKYDPIYCEQLIEHMSQGLSIITFAAEIGVCEDTLYEWMKKHQNFSVSKKIGEALSHRWWMQVGMTGMLGKIKNFNPAIWIFTMKNRFKWKDKEEITIDGNIDSDIKLYPSMTKEEALKLLNKLKDKTGGSKDAIEKGEIEKDSIQECIKTNT